MRALFFSVSTGAGHTKAAQALSEYIKHQDKESCILKVDTLKYASFFVDKIVINVYINMLKTTPKIYGKLYDITNGGHRLGENINGLSNRINKLFLFKIKKLLKEFTPDIIICTHPFALQMARNAKKKLNLCVPLLAVVTDYAVHPLWVKGCADAYILPHEFILNDAMNKGIDRDKIYTYGIPVEDKFLYKLDKNLVRKKFGFEDVTTFLIMGGSLGFGDIENIFIKLIKVQRPLQIVVVTGTNNKLKKQLDKYIYDIHIKKSISILGYVAEINELMDVSDCIITKPGGLTVAEALIKEIPICVISPIPGHEEKNATFLINSGVAACLDKHDSLEDFLCQVLDNEVRYNNMKRITKVLAKPNACKDIYGLIKKLTS
ncbi:MAG: UDP-N-acetylglucosamine--LPS N-acetylglucosamine transferase [Clostridiales bacterium]|nr:UDP-N-acetylglucosamine--LPS N-acetylglucosamine transferase [Clostridiales bacterium]